MAFELSKALQFLFEPQYSMYEDPHVALPEVQGLPFPFRILDDEQDRTRRNFFRDKLLRKRTLFRTCENYRPY